jgi:hypothetical protein
MTVEYSLVDCIVVVPVGLVVSGGDELVGGVVIPGVPVVPDVAPAVLVAGDVEPEVPKMREKLEKHDVPIGRIFY